MDDKANSPYYVCVKCPECGLEYCVHKMRAAHGYVTCKNCKHQFVVMK